MDKIKVLIVDDHTIFRQGLRSLIEAEKDIEVCGEAATGTEAVEMALSLVPDIVIMDITLPELNGLHASDQIQQKNPAIKIIVLSMSADEQFLDHAIDAGVCGYLVKQSAAVELLTAIREVHKGNAYFSAPISRILLDKQRSPGASSSILTLREHEVLQYVVRGKTNREISAILSVSVKTVEKYRQQVMNKLGIHDIVSLTRYALSKGIID